MKGLVCDVVAGYGHNSEQVQKSALTALAQLVADRPQEVWDVLVAIAFGRGHALGADARAAELLAEVARQTSTLGVVLDLDEFWRKSVVVHYPRLPCVMLLCESLERMSDLGIAVPREVASRAKQVSDDSLLALGVWLMSCEDATAAVEKACLMEGQDYAVLYGLLRRALGRDAVEVDGLFRRKLAAKESLLELLDVLVSKKWRLAASALSEDDWRTVCEAPKELALLAVCCRDDLD